MQIQSEKVPQYLKANGRFCNWMYEQRDGNQTKVPYMPGTTRRASVSDPATFAAFETAISTTGYDGIGIRVCGRIVGIDLDHCTGRKAVTLEWNTEDVGDVFMSQFRGTDVEPYDAIHFASALSDPSLGFFICGDRVLADGKTIGIATGRTFAFYERRMISLAFIASEYAAEGTELEILWGQPNGPQKKIRATVAQFPYYQGEYRNETFDTEKIPHRY